MAHHDSPWRIFWIFLRLGCQAFGGPVAHLAFFQRDLVERRRWVDEQTYADLIAFCQFLPGPSSSQVGMCLGLRRGGVVGMLAAWTGFTLPAATTLVILALTVPAAAEALGAGVGWLRGLHAVVVAIIAWALWGMGQKLCAGRVRLGVALAAAVLILVSRLPGEQFLLLPVAAVVGLIGLRSSADLPEDRQGWVPPRRLSLGTAVVLGLLVAAGLVLHLAGWGNDLWELFLVFVTAGSTVFGGGHVVLPMLQDAVVPRFISDPEVFYAGYGLTQAMPGPIFTLSAFLGASAEIAFPPVLVAVVAVVGIFAPSWIMVPLLLPVWERLRRQVAARAALDGVAAAVVGLLLAVLWDPVLVEVTAGPGGSVAIALALAAFAGLAVGKVPAWLLVVLGGLLGWIFSLAGLPGWT